MPIELIRNTETVKPIEIRKEVPIELYNEIEVIKEVEVVKEVPVEVIKEVTKLEQVEVIKEVPYEVVKQVEVVKEVPVLKEVPITVVKQVEVVKPIEVIKEVPIEIVKEVQIAHEVIKEVPVEVIKEIEVIREVEVEVVKEIEVEKEVVKQVEVIKEVPVEVIKEVEVVKEVEVIKEVPVEVIKEVHVTKLGEEVQRNVKEETGRKYRSGKERMIRTGKKYTAPTYIEEDEYEVTERYVKKEVTAEPIIEVVSEEVSVASSFTEIDAAPKVVEEVEVIRERIVVKGGDPEWDMEPEKVYRRTTGTVVTETIVNDPVVTKTVVTESSTVSEPVVSKSVVTESTASEIDEEIAFSSKTIAGTAAIGSIAGISTGSDKVSTTTSEVASTTTSESTSTATTYRRAADEVYTETVYGLKSNNLQIIEGIGPKTEKLLHKANILTWTQLADTSIEKLERVLKDGGNKFRLQNPSTWPNQASLAEQGMWEDLIALQKSAELGGEPDNNSKLENILSKLGKR